MFGVTQGGRIRHPHAFDAPLQASQVVRAIKGQGCPITCIGQGDGIHHQGHVVHRHGMWPQMRHRAKRRQRIGRHPAKAGFQTHVAAKRSGNTHTACAIGAHGQRSQASTHRSGCATRRPARCTCRVPGVAADACQERIGFAFASELGCGGLAQEHRTSLAQASGDRRIDIPWLIGIDGLAAAQSGPALGQDQVFDGHRYAVQGQHGLATFTVRLPSAFAVSRTGQGSGFIHPTKGVEQRIQPRNTLQHSLRDFNRRGLTLAIQIQELGGGELGQVRHGRSSFRHVCGYVG